MKSKRAREAAEAEDKHVTPVDVEAPPKKRKRNDDDATADVKKKAKKDKKDKKHKKESRKERKDKRKNLQDLPDQDDDEEVVDESAAAAAAAAAEEDSPMTDANVKPASATADAANSDKAAKKKNKKDKKNKGKESQQEEEPSADAEANDESSGSKKKKSKKDKKSSSETANNANNDNNDNNEAVPNGTDADADTAAADPDAKADRHIVFVGNLPFTATAASIQAHFDSLSPIHVRCMSDPADSKPCRGFAFVEFAKVWHMRTCLDKFHHSMFDDGVSPARRINVELTAGGGGKTKRRQEKIQEKNRKLNENRTKRIEREKNAKEESRANGNTNQQQHLEDAIHPSRRGRVPGNAW